MAMFEQLGDVLRATVTTCISSIGHVYRLISRYPNTVDDTGIVTIHP
jgi:hypothetical protein